VIVLGIETSCDETAAAVWRGKVLSNVVASQIPIHARYGGVVPELASRAHEAEILPVIEAALQKAGVTPDQLKGVAVTNQPGLIGSLLVGISAAKAVALARDLPLVGVDHLFAHIHSVTMSRTDFKTPFVCLLASGGHTCLYRTEGPGKNRLLGSTVDDAAGEAFDKVAKLLGLSYPGGPAIERAALEGNAKAVDFPVAEVKGRPLDFSFSGLKTAVLYHLRDLGIDSGSGQVPAPGVVADVAASFQRAAVRALVKKTLRAADGEKVGRVAVAGGVALNHTLRKALKTACEKAGLEVAWPADDLCGDNGAMIASLGAVLLAAGENHGLGLDAQPRRASP